ncbi:unnamed protein product [Ectocarpus sp. 12 AP-2014]
MFLHAPALHWRNFFCANVFPCGPMPWFWKELDGYHTYQKRNNRAVSPTTSTSREYHQQWGVIINSGRVQQTHLQHMVKHT